MSGLYLNNMLDMGAQEWKEHTHQHRHARQAYKTAPGIVELVDAQRHQDHGPPVVQGLVDAVDAAVREEQLHCRVAQQVLLRDPRPYQDIACIVTHDGGRGC